MELTSTTCQSVMQRAGVFVSSSAPSGVGRSISSVIDTHSSASLQPGGIDVNITHISIFRFNRNVSGFYQKSNLQTCSLLVAVGVFRTTARGSHGAAALSLVLIFYSQSAAVVVS